MRYSFRFTSAAGDPYYFYGHKDVHDDAGFDVAQDLTRLHTSVFRGDSSEAPLYGSGELRFALADVPALLASFEVQGGPIGPRSSPRA